MKPAIKPRPSTKPLKGSLLQAGKNYIEQIRTILVATFVPLFAIALLRFLSDDYTGDQYSLVIGLISIFVTLLMTRLAVNPWQPKEVRLISLYNAVFSRYLSGVGLLVLYAAHTLPLFSGLILAGLIVTGDLSALWIVPTLVLCVLGLSLMVHGGFALFALMDDMALSVIQAYRISGRIARRYWRSLLWRLLAGIIVFLILIMIVTRLGALVAGAIQDPVTQLYIDAVLSWLITPWIWVYVATVYQRLVEDYA